MGLLTVELLTVELLYWVRGSGERPVIKTKLQRELTYCICLYQTAAMFLRMRFIKPIISTKMHGHSVIKANSLMI